MLVLGERPERGLAVASAHGDDRELAVEADDLLGELVARDRRRLLDDALPLAVVAETARLHEGREPDVLDRAEAGSRDPEPPEELLLDEPVLAELERASIGHRADAARRFDGDVLELVGDDLGTVGEAIEQVGIVVCADDELSDLARARVGRRVEEAEPRRPSGAPASASIRPS